MLQPSTGVLHKPNGWGEERIERERTGVAWQSVHATTEASGSNPRQRSPYVAPTAQRGAATESKTQRLAHDSALSGQGRTDMVVRVPLNCFWTPQRMAYKDNLAKRLYHAKYNRDQREKRWLSQIVPMDRPWTRLSLAWVAGVFEGEGCFSSGMCRNTRSFVARIAMTDEDVIKRVHAAIGIGLLRLKPPCQSHHKMQYTWTVSGFEDTQAVIAALWPWLGARRRARAKEILSLAREYFATPMANGLPRSRFRRARRAA